MNIDKIYEEIKRLAKQILDGDQLESFLKLGTQDQLLGLKCFAFMGKDFQMSQYLETLEDQYHIERDKGL